MATKLARQLAALTALAGLGLAGPAFAQDKTVRIGVLMRTPPPVAGPQSRRENGATRRRFGCITLAVINGTSGMRCCECRNG